jgi:hypothetical protein
MPGSLQFLHPNREYRDNYLKTLEFRKPDWIPCSFGISPATWKGYRDKLEDIIVAYPRIFGYYKRRGQGFDNFSGPYAEGYYTDNWGCVWHNVQPGLEGQVVGHPLEDWKALDDYAFPDPLVYNERGRWDWDRIIEDVERRRELGLLTSGTGERLFDRLYFLRGFKNLMRDIVTDDPHLPKLLERFQEHEMILIKKWLEIGVDIMSFHTDIGMQTGLMISPLQFRKYVKPLFKELFTTCRRAGVHVGLSSDGRLLDIVDDLVECGVSVNDPQFRANTLDGIERVYKGKLCIDLDLDRQMFAFCKPKDIHDQIRESVERLNSPDGGFMMKAEVSGTNVPLENIEAICMAMEQFCLDR